MPPCGRHGEWVRPDLFLTRMLESRCRVREALLRARLPDDRQCLSRLLYKATFQPSAEGVRTCKPTRPKRGRAAELQAAPRPDVDAADGSARGGGTRRLRGALSRRLGGHAAQHISWRCVLHDSRWCFSNAAPLRDEVLRPQCWPCLRTRRISFEPPHPRSLLLD